MTPAPERILAIKLAGLGDLLLCEPALRSLRRSFSDSHIDVLTTPEAQELLALFDGNYQPLLFPKDLFDQLSSQLIKIGAIQLFNLLRSIRRANYDLVVLFHHLTTSAGAIKFRALVHATGSTRTVGLDNGRGSFLAEIVEDAGFGAFHETDYMLAVAKKAGGTDVAPRPSIVAQSDISNFQLPDNFIAMYPVTGSYSSARNWETSQFTRLGINLAQEGFSIVLVGGSDSKDSAVQIHQRLPEALDLTGRTSIGELAAVLRCASVAVGADTFAGHLAAAVCTPVVSIFGPSNHRAWRPYGSKIYDGPHARCSQGLVVSADLPCSPCLYTGYRLGRPDGCPDRTCVRSISVETVFAAVMSFAGSD